MDAVITLTTDFGHSDAYVGVMKGVILGINPRARVVDISHLVGAQDIAHGAYLLGVSYRYFPQGTIHVAVVDPGVGTHRRALLVQTGYCSFVLPDNGLLGLVLRDAGVGRDVPPETPFLERVPVELPDGWKAFALTAPRYWVHPVSTTFHGRDIFAPVAAHLSAGVHPEEMGETVSDLYTLHIPQPVWQGDTLEGFVLRVDAYGNLVTTIPVGMVTPGIRVHVKGETLTGLTTNFDSAERLIAMQGSGGYVEIAAPGGSAARLLGCGVGELVTVRPG